jgi:type IX secretion system PorP/SprF family membrane protein
MKKCITLLLLWIGFSGVLMHVMAQDVHFSQFYASPLSLNPAHTGNYKGDWRLMNSYRRQWMSSFGEPYVTNAFGYDRQFYLFNENISGGLVWIQDKSGWGDLKVTKIYGSAAYHKNVNGHQLHAGIQGGYVQKSFNIDKLTFPDQWDHDQGQFVSTMANNENISGDQLSYFDFNAGVSYGFRVGRFEPRIGYAIYHLNRPAESFYDQDASLAMRHVLDIGGNVELDARYFLMPKFLYMSQNGANEMLIGSNAAYRLPANKMKIAYAFGGMMLRSGISRNSDALVFVGGLNFKELEVGLSYDQNISELRQGTSGVGAFEISLIYTGISTVLEQITIPCERY